MGNYLFHLKYLLKKVPDPTLQSMGYGHGWDMRQLANEQISEFYWVHRLLRFKKSKDLLREYIIDEINNQLIEKLRTYGVNLEKIEVEGVPSSKDYSDRLGLLMDGKISFHEALDLCD